MIGARNARPAPVTRRHPDDAGDRRGGKAAWHSRARPQHRRQGRAREPQRAAVDLTRAFSTRGQVVHRSLLNRRHDQHVRENAPVERERASGSSRREPAGKVDLDVVKIQKLMIERISRLVDRLLDGEEKFCPQRVVSNRTPPPGVTISSSMSGGNGAAGSISMPTASRSRRSPTDGDSNSIIVRHRAYDSGGPDRGARCAPEDRKAGKAHRVHQLARHTPCSAAGAAPPHRREG